MREVLPPVWRRFLVPGSVTLPGLHRVIQEVMGWENYHLHLFRFGEKVYGVSRSRVPLGDAERTGSACANFSAKRGDVRVPVRLGDNWEHDVVVVRIVTGVEVTDARCLEGGRACPPEDVGGPPGYMDYSKPCGTLPIRTTSRWWSGGGLVRPGTVRPGRGQPALSLLSGAAGVVGVGCRIGAR